MFYGVELLFCEDTDGVRECPTMGVLTRGSGGPFTPGVAPYTDKI